MLVYEKKVDGERRLLGTLGQIPSEDDVELTYKDLDGDEISPIKGDIYRDNKSGGMYRESDGKTVNVFIGDTCIIGKVEEKNVKKITIKTAPTKKAYIEGEQLDLTGMVVEATFLDGDKTIITDYLTEPANGTVLTTDATKVVVSYGGKIVNTTISVREYIHSEVSTDIGDKVFVAGAEEPVEYTFSTVAGDDAGMLVKGYVDFDLPALIEYYEVKDGNWYEFKGGEFGPKTGFPLSDATSKFRAKFNAGSEGTYDYSVNIKSVDDGSVICSVNATITVIAE